MSFSSSFLRRGLGLALLPLLITLPGLNWAHGDFHPHAPRALPQSPLVGLPPTYNPPGQLPPTYIPPGQLPPWAYQPPAPGSIPSLPSDPGLSQRSLLNEELRLRGWQQDNLRARHEHDGRGQDERGNWRDERMQRNSR